MSYYCSATGGEPDGKCVCGQPATTEIQQGWHNGRQPDESSGGCYQELCDRCYAEHVAEEMAQGPGR